MIAIKHALIARRDDKGQATTLLLVAMFIVILSSTALLLRIGHANDLRTRARQAADSAALAAVTTIRDRAIAMIQANIAPAFIQIDDSGKQAADGFAQRNGSLVTGYEGAANAVKVSVRTRECQRNEPGGGRFSVETPCVRADDEDKSDRQGLKTATATSAAEIEMPICLNASNIPPNPGFHVECGGTPVVGWSTEKLASLFHARLSSSFNPSPILPFGLADGNVPNLPPASDPQRHANEALGQKLARDVKHWEGQEWECLDQLWLHESGWDHHADNPSSSAYGIPQALPGSKMASAGADWASNPETQIRWGLDYIDDRYGTPCNAWAQWQARNPHWY